jgi:hypothetical protein
MEKEDATLWKHGNDNLHSATAATTITTTAAAMMTKKIDNLSIFSGTTTAATTVVATTLQEQQSAINITPAVPVTTTTNPHAITSISGNVVASIIGCIVGKAEVANGVEPANTNIISLKPNEIITVISGVTRRATEFDVAMDKLLIDGSLIPLPRTQFPFTQQG